MSSNTQGSVVVELFVNKHGVGVVSLTLNHNEGCMQTSPMRKQKSCTIETES